MRQYKLYNLIGGWVSFGIAAVIYLLTIEPTASFWDCGEFIATAYKLEVGHPPGAPFFMLLGRFFTLFSGSPEHVAVAVNSLSALASALTIAFLFWTTTHLAHKILIKNEADYTLSNILAMLGSGLLGAMVYTFTDTFWFSATEAEVYATSSLFTAVVFWAILKWENEAYKKHSSRWIILIAYLMGLSIGVHLLNLLAIPAIVLVYYFKKYKVTLRGAIGALLISFLILGFVLYMFVPGVLKVGSLFELLFVNGFGLPYHSGVIFYILLLIALIGLGLYYTHQYKRYVLNTILLGLTVMLIGYSSYATIMIRSTAEPPMDQNNPETIFNLLSYLNREQYGDRPLFYGHYYNAPVTARKQSAPIYEKADGQYKVVDHKTELEYDSRFTGFFPRMYSSQSQHVKDYKEWVSIDGKRVTVQSRGNQPVQKTIPSVAANLEFLFKYQIGHMYLRYFMWNFSGRQNDIQGHGNVKEGNWITGISFIDNARLGPQNKLPDDLKNNPARNSYYMLPFLLGLIGIWYHIKKHSKGFGIVLILFLFTGIAVVYYLNQYPHQPRERDYAYAGSFYAYAIWIGFSVLALWHYLRKYLPAKLSAVLSTLILLPVPILMASENWDDHDRSGRYTTRDFACNYLNSCRQNGILFTNGDNDTYPLWYAQEVEGIRTDVRVANLSYLRSGWYLEQMLHKAYESDPLPLTHTEEQLGKGIRDVIPVYNRVKNRIPIDKVIDFVANEDEKTKIQSPFDRNKKVHYIPSTKFSLKVDKDRVIRMGTISKDRRDEIVPEMKWNLNQSYIMKDGLCILDLMATNNWERPIHFAVTVSSNKHFNLEQYFEVEGLSYHLAPIKADPQAGRRAGEVNTERMYDLMMNKFKWGNIEDPDVYLNQDNRRILNNMRSQFSRLAVALYNEGKQDSAKKVMDFALEKISNDVLAYGYFSLPFIRTYYKINEKEQARKHLNILLKNLTQEMDYYVGLKTLSVQFPDEIKRTMYSLRNLSDIADTYGDSDLSQSILQYFDRYMNFLQQNQQLIKSFR
jgi:hypothetical protein